MENSHLIDITNSYFSSFKKNDNGNLLEYIIISQQNVGNIEIINIFLNRLQLISIYIYY